MPIYEVQYRDADGFHGSNFCHTKREAESLAASYTERHEYDAPDCPIIVHAIPKNLTEVIALLEHVAIVQRSK